MMHTTYLYSYRYSYRGLELPCPGYNVGRGVAGPVSWLVGRFVSRAPPTHLPRQLSLVADSLGNGERGEEISFFFLF